MSSESSQSCNVHFKKIQRFSTDYANATVTQYESTLTGMRIVVVDLEGPKVTGNFTLATEILDDSGAPHTLEHLCFLGSRNYQYKGFLDKLATRAYANTNAYTATDHTTYELDAAGWEAFAQILPVYLEHLILPTLTDSGCYTEVHHVDGSGNDAGVVYSEMQGFESDVENLMHWNYKRMLYPEGIGFRYETGGRLDQIRVLTPQRIRDFHRDMYQPRNLCLTLTGFIDHVNLLEILHRFECTIVEDVPKPDAPFRRPWIDSKQVPRLVSSIIETIEFPEKDESMGEVSIQFFGPDFLDSLLCGAINVLLTYLTGSSASILINTLVEREQLANSVSFNVEYRPETVIQFFLSGIATEKLDIIENKFFAILNEAATKPLDMDYMKDCIRREKRRAKFDAESTSEYYSENIIKDFVFGRRDGSSLQTDLETLQEFDTLEAWHREKWRHFLSSWLAEAPHATILAKPSAKLSKQLRSAERNRVAKQKADLGQDGLKKLKQKLTAAQNDNDLPIPKALFERFKIPSTESIHFIKTTTARSGHARKMGMLDNPIQEKIDNDREIPLFIHFEHIQSNFAYLTLVLGTEVVPQNLRPLLTLYVENFFSTPMRRGTKVIDFEHVIMELERDTVGYEIESGQRVGNSESIIIKLYVEVEKYDTAIRWLKDLLTTSIMDIDRFKATTARILAGIPGEKRDGDEMVKEIALMVSTAPSSIGRACGTLSRSVYFKHVRQTLESDPKSIQDQLKEVNAALCQAGNFRVLVVADIHKLQHPVSSWSLLMENLEINAPLMPLDSRLSRLSKEGKNPGDSVFIVPLPTIESSFAIANSRGPSSYGDPMVPALMVAISYLNAIEGPVWVAVRGTGLAYSSSFIQSIENSQVSLSIYMSPDASKAFLAIRKTVEDIVSDRAEIDSLALEGAVSSIVLSFANADATMAHAAESSFVRQVMRNLPKDWPAVILERVRKVQVNEMKQALEKFIMPIFEGGAANLFVTCAPNMEKQLQTRFTETGFSPKVKPLVFFQDDYGLQGEGKSLEDDEDEDADGDSDMEDDEDEAAEESNDTEELENDSDGEKS